MHSPITRDTMIVIVCGGRHFTNGAFLFAEMDRLREEFGITHVIEGGQRTYAHRKPIGGADFFAHEWAELRGVLVTTEYAKWKDLTLPDAVIKFNTKGEQYDANAGFRRNAVMLSKHQPRRVIGFHPSGQGTKHMLGLAMAAGVETIELQAPAP